MRLYNGVARVICLTLENADRISLLPPKKLRFRRRRLQGQNLGTEGTVPIEKQLQLQS